jgi:hypothetical protein
MLHPASALSGTSAVLKSAPDAANALIVRMRVIKLRRLRRGIEFSLSEEILFFMMGILKGSDMTCQQSVLYCGKRRFVWDVFSL